MHRDVTARTGALASATRNLLLQFRGRLNLLNGQLEALSPLAILERGYALVFDADGTLVKDANSLHVGGTVRTKLAHGQFTAEVKKTSREG
jgi:exodeoxyribonuclease VII large subunit